jgi:hypothetical protein
VRRVLSLVAATILLGPTACGLATGDDPATSTAATSTPGAASAPATTSPAASPTPTVDPGALEAAVGRARLRPRDMGGAQVRDERFPGVFITPCAIEPTATRWAEGAWGYIRNGMFTGHGVGAYTPDGSSVVDDVRRATTSCRTWRSDDNKVEQTMLSTMSIRRPAEADNAIAFCFRLRYLSGPVKGDSIIICQAFLSRGFLAMAIGVYAKTVTGSQARLRDVVPLAALSLRRALPRT